MAAPSIAFKIIDQCSRSPFNRSLIASVKVGKHPVQVVSNGTTLYFYKQKKRMVIYKLPRELLCWCISLINETKTLMCGLEDGRICAINLKDVIKHKKRKHVNTIVKSESSEDIFAGLLENEMAPSVAKTSSSNSEDIQELDERSVVLNIENIVKLLMIGSYLFTASTEGDKILISVFQQKTIPDEINERQCASHLYFEKLHGYERIFKCQKSASVDVHQCTKMYCVVSETIATACQFQEAVIIKDDLFNEIFGLEYNILGSCMILIGLPDGAVVTMPFKDVSDFTTAHVPTENILYNLRQPLTSIFAITSGQTHRQQVGDTLLLLGREGKLLTIGLKKDDETLRAVFKECYVQEPVQTVIKVSSCMLLYSTGKELLQLRFNTQESDGKLLSDSFSSHDLGITQVVALSEVYHNRGQDDLNLGNVFLLTSRGKIGNVQIPDGMLNTTHSDSAASTGEKIQELLTVINNLATEMKTMKDHSQLHNAILFELNKACHFTSELTLLRTSEKHSSLVCDANLHVDAQGTSNELCVTFSVVNQSSFTMSFGWSFHVMITGERDWFSQGNQHHAVISKSIPLSSFHPGERRELKVNLTDANICLPIDITLAVHFDASNLVAKLDLNEKQVSDVNLHNGSVVIPITSIHFDLLDVLKPMTSQVAGNSVSTTNFFQTKSGSSKAGAGMVGWMLESMQSLVESKLESKEPVISEILSFVLHIKTFNLCQIISSEDGLNSEKLFRWLLPSTTNHLPPGALADQVTMTTMSPEGYQVMFTLSINKEETSITLQAKQIQVLCQVMMAVHLRMKDCLQRIESKHFLLDEIHERINNLKEMCEEIEDFKCRMPSSSLQSPSEREVHRLMQIYINARSQLI